MRRALPRGGRRYSRPPPVARFGALTPPGRLGRTVAAARDGTRERPVTTLPPVAEILIAADAQWVVDEVVSALSSTEDSVRTVHEGAQVLPAVAEHKPDLAVVDL